MKIVKTLIVFAALALTVAVAIDIVNLVDVENNPNKFLGAYVAIGALALLLVALIFVSFSERKIRKLRLKIEEKDQEIGRLQKSLEQANDVITIAPEKGEDVKM